jgi:hypothetical protein
VRGEGSADDAVQQMLRSYNIYDEHVDVVSAMEWLFTATKEIPSTVVHFERFPTIKVSQDLTLTPDFTVLFVDGTAIIGEIAQFAVRDSSVDDLCRQLDNYDALTVVPDADGNLAPVASVDVVLFVPARIGQQAVRRVIVERLHDTKHPFSAAKPPVITQFSRDSERYTFQRLANAENGTLPTTRSPMTLGFLLDNDLSPLVNHFKDLKSDKRFMNDQIDPLYLATHLWTATWPTLFPGRTEDIYVAPADLAELLRSQFGKGSAKDVKRALELLQRAGLAAPNADRTWTVSRKKLSQRGERDVHKIIAQLAVKKPRPRVVPRHTPPSVQYTQESLF